MSETSGSRVRSAVQALACSVVIAVVAVSLVGPLLVCDAPCMIDFDASFVPDTSVHDLRATDTRLNAWILWWVQSALLSHPLQLFDANIFWPASGTLVGSEHMLTLAVVTLPLRFFTDDALLVYHAAMLLTFVATGLAAAAFVRWLTGDATAALVAGVLAMLMPWRIDELVHLQLLSAGTIPLVWLLAARLLDARSTRAAAALLLATAAQLFASYYVAYFTLFSTVAFVLVYALSARAGVRGSVRAAVPIAVASAALAVVSIPYLMQQRSDEVVLRGSEIVRSLAPSWVLARLAPSIHFGAGAAWARGYEIPFVALVLGTIGVASVRDRRLRPAVLGVLAAVAVALVMSLGERLGDAESGIAMPAAWASRFVPGFASLRAPLRWTMLVGIALPLLAGLGLAGLRTAVRRRNGDVAAAVATGVLLLVAALDFAPPRISSMPVSAGFAAELPALRELARLGDGPVLDLPWPQNLSANAHASSEHMVASTVHGKPILSGYTAYFPRHYDFLLEASRRLPDARVLANLERATGLRWIVLHHAALAPGERDAWEQAAFTLPLVTALRDDAVTIYEIPEPSLDPLARARLLATEPSRLTMNGLVRTPLEVFRDQGAFDATIPSSAPLFDATWTKLVVPVRIENRTAYAWPGLDPHREGLVLVRYRFHNAAGTMAEGLAALDGDVAAGSSLSTYVVVEGHVGPGTHRLELALVQQVRGVTQTLPFAPVTASVAMLSATP